MATQAQGFIAAAPPTRTARVSNTTLFHLALRYYGDPLRWVDIAEANGLIDPWVTAQTVIAVPDLPATSVVQTGILGL